MSVLAAELGHEVTALDLAPAMLAEAERKAADRGVALTIVNAPATEPPEGPFDAVIERHMLWTAPDPVGALRAWRDRLAPGGRVVLLEGIWQAEDPLGWVRERLARAIRSIEGSPHDHHAEYDPEVLASLPLRRMGPRVLLEAVAEAGYRGARIERLRDVEWARSLANGWLLGPLERRAQFALVAEPAA
jgi:SAM-dependent methyltransferase